MNENVFRGVVHGNTIELSNSSGLAEGEMVEVVVRRVSGQLHKTGEGLLRTEGALADDPYWDDIMEEIQLSRKQERTVQDE